MKIRFYAAQIVLLLTLCGVGLAQTPTEKTVSVFGVKIHYIEAGDPARPKVILLHGLGADTNSWQFNIAALAREYHVFVPDQVGFGKSDKPLIKYRVGTYVDFLDKFMSELKIDRASLVGNSLGGWIAATMAIKYPNRVERLVLVDAAGLRSDKIDPALIWSLNFSTREEARLLVKLVYFNHAIFDSNAAIDEVLKNRIALGDGYTISSIIESILRGEDFIDSQLGEIKKPTLIVWGKYDGLVPLSDGERFQKGIAGSRLIVLDRAAHVPQIEAAAEFNKAVIGFLSEK